MENAQKVYSDDVIFINRSNYDGEEFLKINSILSRRYLRGFLAIGLVAIGAALFVLGASIMLGFDSDAITYLIALSVIGLSFVITYFIIPMILKKNKRILDGINYEFLLYDSKMEISAISNTINAKETRLYEEIKNGIIINEYIFLYVSKTQAYIMKKDPNAERIIEFLRGKNIRFIKIK